MHGAPPSVTTCCWPGCCQSAVRAQWGPERARGEAARGARERQGRERSKPGRCPQSEKPPVTRAGPSRRACARKQARAQLGHGQAPARLQRAQAPTRAPRRARPGPQGTKGRAAQERGLFTRTSTLSTRSCARKSRPETGIDFNRKSYGVSRVPSFVPGCGVHWQDHCRCLRRSHGRPQPSLGVRVAATSPLDQCP